MSKYRREEPAPITKHRHCAVCGIPTDMNKPYCSEKCRLEGRRLARSKTRNFMFITGAVIIIYVIFILLR